jgi:hypothetical protein
MTHDEISKYNEALAIQKIKQAYIQDGFVAAMSLCAEYMGIEAREACNRTKMLCTGLTPLQEATL